MRSMTPSVRLIVTSRVCTRQVCTHSPNDCIAKGLSFIFKGRGGLGNIAPDGGPGTETIGAAGHPTESHNHEFTSSGRGGAGNIRQRSGSREPSKVSAFLHRLGHGKDGDVEAK